MMIERLQQKAARVEMMLQDTNNDWHTVLMRLLFQAFGFGTNRAPFERLVRLVSYRQMSQHRNDLTRVEAMLFGCAGMLNQIFVDDYPNRLQREFYHLARKYDLRCMQARAWQWGRVRPANFPTMRIAQLATLMTRYDDLLQVLSEATQMKELHNIFSVKASPYWREHSNFDRPGRAGAKQLGTQSTTVILINAIVPFLFCYGRKTGKEAISERAVNFMADMKPEFNQITKRWMRAGLSNRHAGDSQGMIHLKRNYCDQFMCTSCAIGHHLLKNTDHSADV